MTFPTIQCQACRKVLAPEPVKDRTVKTTVEYDCSDCDVTYVITYVEKKKPSKRVNLGEVRMEPL